MGPGSRTPRLRRGVLGRDDSNRGNPYYLIAIPDTRIIMLLSPLCFRSSCQSVQRCTTNFGSGALGVITA